MHEDLSYDISMNDDQLYSNVEDHKPCSDEGACGYTAQGEEQSSSDPRYTDAKNISVYYATVKKDRPPNNKKYKDNPLYAVSASPLDRDHPPYLKMRKNEALASVDNLARIHESKANTKRGYNSESEDDALYSTVNKKDALNINRKHVAPVYSTVRKKTLIVVTSNGAGEGDVSKVDPLYSVVDKKKIRGMDTDDWNQAVPPAPSCSNSVVPTYSKVIKKNKKGQAT